VHAYGGDTSIRVPELLVGSALPNFGKSEPFQTRDYLARFENRNRAHCLRDKDCLRTYEFRFQRGFAILKQHRDHLAKIGVQLIESLALTMSPSKSGDKAYKETGFRITLDNSRVGCHG
jgi:hypothetical protein